MKPELADSVILTHHARARLRQRGMKESDLEIVLRYGTNVREGVVLTDRDVSKAIRERRREIQRLEHLRGRTVIIEEGVVVTAYTAKDRDLKRKLRNRRA